MPEQLGRYEILEEIGQGGFAIVHRARDTELNRMVALKELRSTMLQDADWVRRFKREARTIARLDHHRIVTIHDVVDLENRLVRASGVQQVLSFLFGPLGPAARRAVAWGPAATRGPRPAFWLTRSRG